MLSQALARHATSGQVSATASDDHVAARLPTSPRLGDSILQSSKSAGNRLAQPAPYRTSSHGVKRTSSGLAKALGNNTSFDENSPGSSAVPVVTQSEHFQVDDFDSDLDIEVDSAPIKTIRASKTNGFAKPATKTPQIHDRVRPSNTVTSQKPRNAEAYHTHAVTELIASAGPPPSSDQQIPWSSSPPEHTRLRIDDKKPLEQFAYAPAVSRPQAPKSTTNATAPTKRRTLPWLKAESNESNHAKTNTARTQPSTSYGAASEVPQVEAKSKTQTWNTTFDAMKEQQRTLREVNKVKSKRNKATQEDLEKARKHQQASNMGRLFLSAEQKHVCNLVVEKRCSVFFTGSAGTGKSVLLREIIALLRKKHVREPDRVAVTASTGLAACNIGGVTLHSFAGIGLGKEPVPELVKKIKRNSKAKHRWMRTKTLVIDEISMVDGALFDKLEAIGRAMRGNGRPFGGIQLVITGDFFQLPPVPDPNTIARFAFDAGTWSTSIEHTIGLHHVFRQKDPVFAGMLNEMREGRLSPASIAAFQKLSRPLEAANDLMATELFPTRQEVERANSSRMSMLVGDTRTFDARDGGTADEVQRDRLLSSFMAPKTMILKKGSQVMLIKNIDETLVNGSVGKVIGFMDENMFDRHTMRKDEDDDVDATTTTGKHAAAAARIAENLSSASSSQHYPLVRFVLADGTSRELLCQREQWTVELPNGEVQASRSQVPLILAWALSIHKAQGQTLERVKVDLGKVFEKGQAYVALSRATSMEGLQVLRFDAKRVMAHDKVRTFYQQLSRVEELEVLDNKKPSNDPRNPRYERPKTGVAAQDYEAMLAQGLI